MKDFKTAYNKMYSECLNAIPKALSRGCGAGHEIAFCNEGCSINTCPSIVYNCEHLYVTHVFEHNPSGRGVKNDVLLKVWYADKMTGMPDEPSERRINTQWLDLQSLVNICDGIRTWKEKYGR